MELKIFGKSIFGFKKKSDVLSELATKATNEVKSLPDFNDFGRDNNWGGGAFLELTTVSDRATKIAEEKNKKGKKKDPEEKKLTPKEVYELKALNETFLLKTDPEYVNKQIDEFKTKLDLLKDTGHDYRRGVNEVSSVLLRLENRKKYVQFKDFFEQFAYTTSAKIGNLLGDKKHDNLKLGQVEQFMADMPQEATKVMKDYDVKCKELCGKKAVFYIIADKKDFEKTEKRRDPILLAQSPFGHFWQILGAWDKEMLLLSEL